MQTSEKVGAINKYNLVVAPAHSHQGMTQKDGETRDAIRVRSHNECQTQIASRKDETKEGSNEAKGDNRGVHTSVTRLGN